MSMFSRRCAPTCASALVLLASAATQPAFAQSVAAEKTQSFNISAGPLAAALNQFASESRIALVCPAELARGRRTQGVSGSFSLQAALSRLLEGTNLTYRFSDAATVVIEAAPPRPAGARVLGRVQVEGVSGATIAGRNGSSDATATEGTGSYTSGALTIASKTAQSIKDTPQSVSVITQQRLQDSNLTDFTSVMNQATGITMVTSDTGSLSPTFFSRGFLVQNIQVDGGAPLFGAQGQYGYFPQIDMAMYDHVELLRGASGQFTDYGQPGGSVNLVRKRPLDHALVTFDAQTGSWNHYRGVADVTGPLAFDGKLRGRAVLSVQDNDFFYDVASNHKTLAYGVLEADLAPDTVGRMGFSYQRQDAVPWMGGLPRYQDGADLKLSRDTCLCFPWNRWSFQTDELFAQLSRQFGENLAVNLNVTRNRQQSQNKIGRVSGTVNPTTGQGPFLAASMAQYANLQTLADLAVNGSFELFGQSQQVVFGANFQDVDGDGIKTYPSLISSSYVAPTGAVGVPLVDVFHFDPSATVYGEPASAAPKTQYLGNGQRTWGMYANARLTPLQRLHVIAGMRYTYYGWENDYVDLNRSGVVTGETRRVNGSHDVSWPPSYAVVYDVTKNLSTYASYEDIYISQADQLDLAGKPLAAVTGSTVEVGVKWESDEHSLNASVAAYRAEEKGFANFLDYGPYAGTRGDAGNGVTCCYNTESNKSYLSRGADAEVNGEVLPGWQLSAGYTFNQNDQHGAGTAEGKPLISLAPKHLFKLWTTYRLPGGLSRLSVGAGATAQTRSFQSGTACITWRYGTDTKGNPTAFCTATASYDFTQGFYAVLSARAAYQFSSRWNAALNVDNLTDRVYYQTVSTSAGDNWYGEPRRFMLSLRGQF